MKVHICTQCQPSYTCYRLFVFKSVFKSVMNFYETNETMHLPSIGVAARRLMQAELE